MVRLTTRRKVISGRWGKNAFLGNDPILCSLIRSASKCFQKIASKSENFIRIMTRFPACNVFLQIYWIMNYVVYQVLLISWQVIVQLLEACSSKRKHVPANVGHTLSNWTLIHVSNLEHFWELRAFFLRGEKNLSQKSVHVRAVPAVPC